MYEIQMLSCQQYWGWCKYQYREGPKNNFAEAKEAAIQFLNACPLDVLRRFINRSWSFMSAYRKGLNGEAAAWAVRKQKQHRSSLKLLCIQFWLFLTKDT